MADAPFYASILDGATFPPLHYPTMLVMLNFQSAYLLQNNIIMVEVVSKELNHFGVIAGSSRLWVIVIDLCYFALFEDFSP